VDAVAADGPLLYCCFTAAVLLLYCCFTTHLCCRRKQADIIEWMRWLRTDLGFDAFRFDNTKGYAGGFTNYYIQQTDPVYTVSQF
jgi:hypothetical protein